MRSGLVPPVAAPCGACAAWPLAASAGAPAMTASDAPAALMNGRRFWRCDMSEPSAVILHEKIPASMAQPNRAQWVLICAVTVILILCWPPDRGHGPNLLIKAAHWAVDPAGSLPAL